MHEKFYYIVGVSLIVLLVLVVYVGSRVQNLELALINIDSRLSAIEQAIDGSSATSYDDTLYGGSYDASVYDAFDPYADYAPDYYTY